MARKDETRYMSQRKLESAERGPLSAPIPCSGPSSIDPEKRQAVVNLALHIDSLIPRAKLRIESVAKVACVLVYMGEEFLEFACEAFRENTTLESGTRFYNRAEFFNVWWFMACMTGAGPLARHEPYFLATFDLLERLGVGPLVPYQSARAQLREIVGRVRRALDPNSNLANGWRQRTLSEYPVIAQWLPKMESLTR